MKNFDTLLLEDKVDLLLKDGIYLESVQHSIYQADLYAVHDMFIEVLLFPQTCDFVHVRVLSEKGLEKYLDLISWPQSISD